VENVHVPAQVLKARFTPEQIRLHEALLAGENGEET